MALSNELISAFVKATNDSSKETTSNKVNGTVTKVGDNYFVKIDGSEVLTPVSTTASLNDDDRVELTIENHSATVTGNLTNNSVGLNTVVSNSSGESTKTDTLGNVVAKTVTTETLDASTARIINASIDSLTAVAINTKLLTADNANLKSVVSNVVSADYATLDELHTKYLTATDINTTYLKTADLSAETARIVNLEVENELVDALDAHYINANDLAAKNANLVNAEIENAFIDALDAKYTRTDELDADVANIINLNTETSTTTALNAKYADINFANVSTANVSNEFVNNLMIQSSFIAEEGTVYSLQSLHINAEDITTGVLSVDRLIVKDSAGESYLVEPDASTGELSYVKIEGSIIQDESITADKLIANSITTEQLTTENIGGTGGWVNFSKGEMCFQNAETGSGISFQNGKLTITADSLFLSNGKTINETITEVSEEIEVGGRNFIRNSTGNLGLDRYWTKIAPSDYTGNISVISGRSNENKAFNIKYDSQTTSGTYGIKQDVYILETGNYGIGFWYTLLEDSGKEYDVYPDNDVYPDTGMYPDSNNYGYCRFRIYNDAGNIILHGGNEFIADGTWHYYSTIVPIEIGKVTFEIDADISSSIGFSFTFGEIKLENGNKNTGWTPASEDAEDVMADLKDEIYNKTYYFDMNTKTGFIIGDQKSVIKSVSTNDSYSFIAGLSKDDDGDYILNGEKATEEIIKENALMLIDTEGVRAESIRAVNQVEYIDMVEDEEAGTISEVAYWATRNGLGNNLNDVWIGGD